MYDVVLDDIFLELRRFVPNAHVFLKLEGLNPAGSIKLKTAVALIADAEENRGLAPGGRIIESSSGNLGIALSMVCAAKGYELTIVTDANANASSIRAMRTLGTHVVRIETPDADGGFLHRRIDYIHQLLTADPKLIWLNQYASPANPQAHRDRTARNLHNELQGVDVVVVGVGTSGTLMGFVDYQRAHGVPARIVAVDSEGSITFGGPPGRRHIPGLGASRRPEIYTDDGGFEKITVPEHETVAVCREVALTYGLLIGGSTGTALAGARRIGGDLATGSKVAVIAPDLGDRYLDTVYSDQWVADHLTHTPTSTGAGHV